MIRSTTPAVDSGARLRRINVILSALSIRELERMREGFEARGDFQGARLSKLVSLELRGRDGLRPIALVDGVRYYYSPRRR